ncbi:MAG: PD40 domain-containing protein [Prolixibacteraceae bacterium]|nr:PD40 domain-containing protein [Prolixibacteraceae bacterium]MBN2650197.1 PD40 domain-containing protein [Prolixibacteraceae bacterium]
MNRILYINLALMVCFLCFSACNTSKTAENQKSIDYEVKNAESQINFQSPVNTADERELNKPLYKQWDYLFVQKREFQFKDNAPFIQLLNNGKTERLWFASSRGDSLYNQRERTNNYQQIYFSERTVDNGKCPWEGWSEPHRFSIDSDNPMLSDFYNAFNKATKGAPSLAGNTMVFSCDQLNVDPIDAEFKNLWSVEFINQKPGIPRPLNVLSGSQTWESHPALSPDGKHLFFVSNRKVTADGAMVTENQSGDDLNIFYSYNKDGSWQSPVLVKEIYGLSNEITPHVSINGDRLYFSSDKSGDYEIFQAELELKESGGFLIREESLKLFDEMLMDNCSENFDRFALNGAYNQKYPFYYYNPQNAKTPQAFLWSSDNPEGYGSFDIYGCGIPFNVELNVVLIDKSATNADNAIEMPCIEIAGALSEEVTDDEASFNLYSGLKYQLSGGSYASPDYGTYYCDRDQKYVFTGYSRVVNEADPFDKVTHNQRISGSEVPSVLTDQYGYLPVFNVYSDTTINDTVFICKHWTPKPPCPEVLDIPQKYEAIPYFQTGYWDVNTTANLKRDLEKLHEGYEITGSNDLYNPVGHIVSKRSGYKAYDWETPLSPIRLDDNHTYSIADARWIELHPFNYYWGDRSGFEARISERMQGRKKRIAQYVDYAQKVDENLKMLTDTIKEKYINFLDLHKDRKPKLLIEIFAVSDQREVIRGWYIGDTVEYRSSAYLPNGDFSIEPVKIIPPKVDEDSKQLSKIVNCSIELNSDGNNGSTLGISDSKTEINTNLSRLRAWFGYKELYNRLADADNFKHYMANGKVALPDNQVDYEDAEIIILTRGRRIDVINPQDPYPDANNPNSTGYYDYDKIRRVEVRIRLIFDKDEEGVKDFCCYSEE